MNNCTHLYDRDDKRYIRTSLCSSYEGTCDGTITTIYHSQVFCNSILSITINNVGECNVTIAKNGNTIATIVPGSSCALLETGVRHLTAQCATVTSATCSLCWSGCVCTELPCQFEDDE